MFGLDLAYCLLFGLNVCSLFLFGRMLLLWVTFLLVYYLFLFVVLVLRLLVFVWIDAFDLRFVCYADLVCLNCLWVFDLGLLLFCFNACCW